MMFDKDNTRSMLIKANNVFVFEILHGASGFGGGASELSGLSAVKGG
jgi:hypothetical protein